MKILNINRVETFDEVMKNVDNGTLICKDKSVYLFNELKVPIFHDSFATNVEATSFANRMHYRYGKKLSGGQ